MHGVAVYVRSVQEEEAVGCRCFSRVRRRRRLVDRVGPAPDRASVCKETGHGDTFAHVDVACIPQFVTASSVCMSCTGD